MITYYLRNTIHLATLDGISVYWGYIALAVCVVFFSSSNLPIKRFETGDGLFYQMVVSLSIWSIGAILNCVRHFPTFYFLPMVGGLCWTTANVNMVPMIKTIGIGMANLISGTIGILVGWANARFGLLGTVPENPSNKLMNYFGVSLCAISAIFYLFVKSESHAIEEPTEHEPLLHENHHTSYNTHETQSHNDSDDHHSHYSHHSHRSDHSDPSEHFFDDLNPLVKRILGTVLSIISGAFFSLAYVPYLYAMDNYENASQNSLDYIFSMYTGILLSSIFYFAIYCLFKKNRPYVNIRSIFPGLINGWIWSIANCSFLFSNTVLSQAVTFPISGSVRSMISTLYGIFLFKEIKGYKNYAILIAGFILTIIGSLLCGFSK